MKRLLPILLISSSISMAQAESRVGAVFTKSPAAHHGRTIETAVFYPAKGGNEVMMGDNGVFHGTPVAKDATPLPGRYPVVLMSHGWGGNFQRLGWLSHGLVGKGAIVISVNHPNSTTGDTVNPGALHHWTRAQDLSAALTHALADPVFGSLIDPTRIHAAGFSYGGWTALSLGGVKGRRDGIERFCNDPSQAVSHCASILQGGVTIADIDKTKWEAEWKDPRIASVAAIDPALTWGLTKEDVASLKMPLLIIGLGSATDRLHATDTSDVGSGFDALVPAATIIRIAPAAHFTALGHCKPEGADILKSVKDDAYCTDPQGTNRAAVMARIIQAIARHFGLDG